MRISVFGLGYVGTVSATCLARDGHDVIGVDPNPTKVELIGQGRSPVIEAGIAELLANVVSDGKLRATTSAAEAVAQSDLSLVCVGTPSQSNGSLDLGYVERVAQEIGSAIKDLDREHTVVIRSTTLPGTTRDLVIPALEASVGRPVGDGYGVGYNPEFLREGTALKDYDQPPKTVIGALDSKTADRIASLYEHLDAPLIRTELEVAELVKYADNTWHGLKIGFANEVGNIAKALGIDSHRVMEIFCSDTKLNLSPAYLKPGQAFGGSCLPKDIRALTYKARVLDVETPILSAVLPSNQLQLERALAMVMEKGNRKVGVLGMSFKAGTDDLRESPIVELVERLLGKGFDLRIYDRNVSLARLVGANRDFILNKIPHISRLLVEDIDEVIAHAETLVIGNGDPEFKDAFGQLRRDQTIVDLVRIGDDQGGDTHPAGGEYDGICW